MASARRVFVWGGGVAAVLLVATALYGKIGFEGFLDIIWKGMVLLLLIDISDKLRAPGNNQD